MAYSKGIDCLEIRSTANVVDRENPWFGVIPRIRFDDKETYVESETKQYDMVRGLSHFIFQLKREE